MLSTKWCSIRSFWWIWNNRRSSKAVEEKIHIDRNKRRIRRNNQKKVWPYQNDEDMISGLDLEELEKRYFDYMVTFFRQDCTEWLFNDENISFAAHVFEYLRPRGDADLAKVGFFEYYHLSSRLPDSTAYA